LQAGDKVAGAGSFLIDAETRLTGGIGSTYYGASGGPDQKGRSTTTARPSTTADEDADVKEALDRLNPEDRRLANDQEYCPITGKHLGSMGAPVMIDLKGRRVFLCCSSCPDKAKADAQRTLDKVDQQNAKTKDAHGKGGER
jgi:membrane fusion protein, copper/silver efflux system